MKIKTLIQHAIKQLCNDGTHIEANMLLQYVLNVNHAWLIAHADDEISTEQYEQFQALLKRRIDGEPIAYILGEREFYGLTFKTTPDTLIPRSDTETLVEAALAKIPLMSDDKALNTLFDTSFPRRRESREEASNDSSLDSRLRGNDTIHVLDLGTGTGAIALAIAKHRPNAQVTAVDFSGGALLVAQENAANLNIHNVTFRQSNWFDALANQTFDVIVSNPPYIEDDDPHLSQGDLRFEPRAALASGADGLDDIRTIIQQANTYLKPGGWLLLEHGYNQAAAVAELLKQFKFHTISHTKDLAGIPRVTLATY